MREGEGVIGGRREEGERVEDERGRGKGMGERGWWGGRDEESKGWKEGGEVEG